MNRAQAKLILAAYRPNGADASDPRFGEALALARHDPELAAWFARQQEFDGALSAKLTATLPPPELRDSILGGWKIGRHRPKWSGVLAVAAAVILCAAALFLRPHVSPRTGDDDGLLVFATNYAANGIALETHSNDTERLQQWLWDHQAPMPARLPFDVATLRSLGCRTLSFQGRVVTLICFEHGREFHLFVARRADFPQLKSEMSPRWHSCAGSWNAAEWTDADQVYVLVSDAAPSELARQLARNSNHPG